MAKTTKSSNVPKLRQQHTTFELASKNIEQGIDSKQRSKNFAENYMDQIKQEKTVNHEFTF